MVDTMLLSPITTLSELAMYAIGNSYKRVKLELDSGAQTCIVLAQSAGTMEYSLTGRLNYDDISEILTSEEMMELSGWPCNSIDLAMKHSGVFLTADFTEVDFGVRGECFPKLASRRQSIVLRFFITPTIESSMPIKLAS